MVILMKKIIFLSPRYDGKKIYINEGIMQNFHSDYLQFLTLPFHLNEKDLTSLLITGQGLILLGGIDINPIHYQQENTNSEYIDKLDSYDFLLLQICLKNHIPIFGICRGIQVINVFFSGSLKQKVFHHENQTHMVTFLENFLIYQKNDCLSCNSFHHQAIDRLGKGLYVIAKSEDDQIEAIRNQDAKIGRAHV